MDQSNPPPENPLAILTAFTPVPREPRHDGWGPAEQRAFIEALADCGSVTEACRYVGRSPSSAYRLRRHPEGAEFAQAWQVAVDFGIRRIEDAAMDRALNGVEVPVFAYGDKIATRRVHNESLVMFMLRNRAPERYCEGGSRGLSALDKRMLARLEKQWRAAWEEERRLLDAEEEREDHAAIDAWLDTMRANRLAHMSPAQRERQIAADAQARADKAAGWSPGMPYGAFAEEAAALLAGFVAEVEADWPPLEPWAWEAAEDDEAEAPEERPPLPPPAANDEARPDEPSGPRVRTLKDDGW
jgi:hypothetical protein